MTNTRRILLQVTLPFTLVGLVCLGFSFLGVWSINRLQENRARIISTNVRKLQAALEMEIRLRQFRFHSVLMLIEPNPQRRAVVVEDRKQFEAAFASATYCATGTSSARRCTSNSPVNWCSASQRPNV